MSTWRKIDQTWCNWPSKPKAIIEMIGGSYLATTPNISYRLFFDLLIKRNVAIHAWSYVPSFDHQKQANEAWKGFRACKSKLESRVGMEISNSIRIGHSLGSKLHLISPDGGRKSNLFVGISFNNYKVDSSIPLIGKVKKKFNVQTEFSPSPLETMRIIRKNYCLPNNLLIKFIGDKIDQTSLLLEQLRSRESINDNSTIIELNGNHLTPASSGLRSMIRNGANVNYNKNLQNLIDTICKYASI